MNAIAQKLKSRGGVSILSALLLFLVCAFVGGAVLVAAYQNISRSPAIRQEQQAYLAVSSAAQLLKDELVGKSIQLQYITSTTYLEDEEGNTSDEDTSTSRQLARSYTGILAYLSQQALNVFKNVPVGSGTPLAFSLADYPELSDISGTLQMEQGDGKDYFVIALLSNADKGNELRVSFTASANTDSGSTNEPTYQDQGDGTWRVTTVTVHTTTVTWTGASIRLTSIPEWQEGAK